MMVFVNLRFKKTLDELFFLKMNLHYVPDDWLCFMYSYNLFPAGTGTLQALNIILNVSVDDGHLHMALVQQ